MNSVMNIDVPKLQTNDVAFGYNSFYWVYTRVVNFAAFFYFPAVS